MLHAYEIRKFFSNVRANDKTESNRESSFKAFSLKHGSTRFHLPHEIKREPFFKQDCTEPVCGLYLCVYMKSTVSQLNFVHGKPTANE